jgi:hypothetical protein
MRRLRDNKLGFQITIGMLVVIILSIVMLTTGISLFYKGYNQAASLKDQVDTNTQRQLDALMTSSDALIAIPFTTKDAKRGDYVDFTMGINNELGQETHFYVCVSYSGTSADYSLTTMPNYYEVEDSSQWLLMSSSVKEMDVGNNEHAYVPMRIKTPKKILKGQYVFNVVVKYWDNSITHTDDPIAYKNACAQDYGVTQYATTQKLYLTIV